MMVGMVVGWWRGDERAVGDGVCEEGRLMDLVLSRRLEWGAEQYDAIRRTGDRDRQRSSLRKRFHAHRRLERLEIDANAEAVLQVESHPSVA